MVVVQAFRCIAMSHRHFIIAALAAVSLSVAGSAEAQWRYYDGYRTYPPDNSGYPPFPGQDDQRSYEPQPQPQGEPEPQPQGEAQPQQPGEPQPPTGYGYAPPNVEQQQPDNGAALQQPGGAMLGGPMDDAQAAASPRTAQVVQNPTSEAPGTIIVDTQSRHLYFVQQDGTAIQYGIGVGREGFAWKGVAHVDHKSEWPRWFPPKDMLKRRPDLPIEMDGGLNNPLGARALYLYEGKKDTLFRIHGTNEPDTIGKAVSSGCIRMMNGDVMDLYNRVPVGTRVVVL
jgi:lipoprotein-anchoring transpeptidase ErfK/SrfK